MLAAEVVGNCKGDAYDCLVFLCYSCGNCLWFAATTFHIIEALNREHDLALLEWEFQGMCTPNPR